MSNKALLARVDAQAERDTTEYGIILSAVRETARGRWFLHEYARKNRHSDTQLVLEAIEKLSRQTRNIGTGIDTDHIRLELKEMAEAIASTRHEIVTIRSDMEQDGQKLKASCELDSIVAATEKATSEILEAAEQVQETAWTMREQEIDEKSCEKLDALATDIYTACSFQDITGQRTDKVIRVLQYLENRINGMSRLWGAQSWSTELFKYDPPEDRVKAAPRLPGTSGPGKDVNCQTKIDTVMEDTASAQEMLGSLPGDVPDIFEEPLEENPGELPPSAPSEPALQAAQPVPSRPQDEQGEEIEDEDEEDELIWRERSETPAAMNMSSLNSDEMHVLFSC